MSVVMRRFTEANLVRLLTTTAKKPRYLEVRRCTSQEAKRSSSSKADTFATISTRD